VIHSLIGEVQHYVHHYGTLAVFLGIFLEDFGMPTPGETLLITAAVFASHGKLSLYWLLFWGWVGAVLGDNIGYAIGRTGGHRLMLRYGGRVGITQERLDQVERFFDRYGDAVILFARFVVVLRQFNGIVAGTLEMGWWRFLLLNSIGAALWVGFWGVLAYVLGKRVLEFLETFNRQLEPVLIGGALLAVVVVAAHHLWRRRRGRNATGD
jgi:membrane protein DedA with SNARE-associated domain